MKLTEIGRGEYAVNFYGSGKYLRSNSVRVRVLRKEKRRVPKQRKRWESTNRTFVRCLVLDKDGQARVTTAAAANSGRQGHGQVCSKEGADLEQLFKPSAFWGTWEKYTETREKRRRPYRPTPPPTPAQIAADKLREAAEAALFEEPFEVQALGARVMFTFAAVDAVIVADEIASWAEAEE